jgi:hypothetical protein
MQAGARWRPPERKPPVIASTRRGFALIPVLVALAVAVAAGFYLSRARRRRSSRRQRRPLPPRRAGEPRFRRLPALALTFSLPLDPRHAYDGEIEVFEMPPRDGEVLAAAATSRRGWRRGRDARMPPPVASTDPKDVATDGGKRVKGAWTVGDNPRLLFFPTSSPRPATW